MYRSADSSINQSIKICAGNSGDLGGVLRCNFSGFILAGSGDVWFPHFIEGQCPAILNSERFDAVSAITRIIKIC